MLLSAHTPMCESYSGFRELIQEYLQDAPAASHLRLSMPIRLQTLGKILYQLLIEIADSYQFSISNQGLIKTTKLLIAFTGLIKGGDI